MVPCKFFAGGYCMKGENCRYSHEITPPTSNSAGPPPALNDLTNLNTGRRVASHIPKGGPWRDPRLFTSAAGSAKNSLSPKPVQSTRPVSQNSLAFRIGGFDPVRATQDSRSQIPCYYHVRGNCRNGSACPYSHIEGSERKVEATSDPEVRPL